MNHFFTADTHFGHAGVIPWCDRPFSSLEEMDEILIQNWNNTVKPGDYVTHLGDFAWRDPAKYRSRLHGHVRLVLGNHDNRNHALKAGFDWVKELYFGKFCNRPIFCLHYPCLAWPSKTYKSWHLFGHVHGRRKGPAMSLDVGVDVHNYRPISFDEVSEFISREQSPDNAEPCRVCPDRSDDPGLPS